VSKFFVQEKKKRAVSIVSVLHLKLIVFLFCDTQLLDTNHGKGSQGSQKGKQSGSVYKSLRLWNLALDLEESLGGFTNAKACYDRCIEVGAATPQIILNYANFLAENKYFEESFTAYEKGVSLFPFPHVGAQAIWSAYLKDFHKRYGGTKVERSRELYERCVENVIPEKASEFYLMYAKFEETYGLAKRALGVYERLCTTVPKEDKLKAYELYIAKAESFSGPSKTRPIYEAAIAALDDRDAAKMCLQYADLETRLGEIDRARTSLTYGAQMADPRRDPEYWKEWHTFEVAYGNEETFREMLRVKRGVAALFSTVNYNALEMGAAEPAGQPKALTEEEALEMISEREGVKHKTLPSISGFVSSSKRTAAEANLEDLERQAARLRQATSLATAKTTTVSEAPIDDSEINIESEDEEEEEGETHEEAHNTVSNVTLKEIPSAVFGALLDPSANETEKGERATKMGALERLRSAALENK
jgi:pre-mRNA-splicing factor SYF1